MIEPVKVSKSARARAGATPRFIVLCKTLYGPDVDPQVVWEHVLKASPDQADTHAKTGLTRAAEGTALVGTAAGGVIGVKEGLSAARAIRFARKAGQLVPASQYGRLGLAGAAVGSDVLATGVLAAQNRKANTVGKALPSINDIVAGSRKIMGQITGTLKPTGAIKATTPTAAKPAAAAVTKPVSAAIPSTGAPSAVPGVGAPPAGAAGSGAGAPKSTGYQGKHAAAPNTAGAAGNAVGQALGTTTGRVGIGIGAGGMAIGSKINAARQNAGQQGVYGKSAGHQPVDFVVTGEFSKLDADKHLAFGWASVTELHGSPVVDKQGDYITTSDIEDAAYGYVQKCRVGGDMHRRTPSMQGDSAFKVSDLIESIVFTDEKVAKMGLPDDFPRGWWVGFKIHDEPTWQMVRKGERTGFSIHGRGMRKDTSLDEIMGYSQAAS